MRIKFILGVILFVLLSCSTSQKNEPSPEKKKATIYYNQGTNELVKKEYANALKHLLEARALDPKSSKIHNNLGMAYYFKKRPETAIKMIKKAIELDANNMDARMNLGTIYTNTGRFIEAKAQYEKILDNLTYNYQFKTYYNLGILNHKQGRKRRAINYYQQAVNENNNFCPAHRALGNIYFEYKDYEKSLKHYKDATMGTCYNNPINLYKQAQVLIKLKKYATAKLKLEEIMEKFSSGQIRNLASKDLKEITPKVYQEPKIKLKENDKKRKILSPNF